MRRPAFRAGRSRGSSYISHTQRPSVSAGSSANALHRAASSGSTCAGSNGAGVGAARPAARPVGVTDVLDEAVALEIHPRQPVGTLRVPARDAHEVVLHAERLGVLRDAVRDDDRYRPQHELAEHHVMHDPLAVAEVAPGRARPRARPVRAARAPGSRPRRP